MFRTFLISSGFGLVSLGAAFAAEPPTSTDTCLSLVSTLAEAVENAGPEGDARTKIDDLMIQLKTQCDDGNFEQAASIAGEIEQTAGITRQ